MRRYILNICYPTFNRGSRFYNDINDLLSCKDSRFCVTIQDNHSDDGSYEILEKIKDDRLILRRNSVNIGSIPNFNECLKGSLNADYLLFCLDKDYVKPDMLFDFLNYLESEKPAFGYLDPYNNYYMPKKRFANGKDAIMNISYLSKHPSGFFWKKQLIYSEMDKQYFHRIPVNFDFSFDVLTAHIALKYDGDLVFIPLFLQWESRPEYNVNTSKTLSYSENNIYFSAERRLYYFEYYMRDMLSLSLSKKDINVVSEWLLSVCTYDISVALKKKYGDQMACNHYNVSTRDVSIKEMFMNIKKAIKKYKNLMCFNYSNFNIDICVLKIYVLSFIRVVFHSFLAKF